MAVKQPDMIDADDLTDADEAILDELQAGARTKKAIVDSTGLHRNTVGNRLDVLEAGDAVACIHETTALYELVDDPRDSATGDDADLRARLQDALEDRDIAQARADRLEADLEDCQEQLADAREQSSVDREVLSRALDDIEAAAANGNGNGLQEALERAREALQ